MAETNDMARKPFRIEDRMSIEELRREVRRCWDTQHTFFDALSELPDVPPHAVLRFLADYRGGFPHMWEIGKIEQRDHPWGVVPAKTEYEIAQGLWSIIRDALRAHASAIEARSGETREAGLDPKDESAVPQADAQ